MRHTEWLLASQPAELGEGREKESEKKNEIHYCQGRIMFSNLHFSAERFR